MFKILFFALFVIISLPVHAYIGPGMGGGVIAAVLGIIGAFFLALVAIIYYPVKRMLKRNKTEQDKTEQDKAEVEQTSIEKE